jgi:membrane-bound lytic murein transglycosylase F
MVSSAINKILFERTTFILTVFAVWILVVLYFVYPFATAHKFVTLHKILKRGELTVITKNTAHSYYLYHDEPMGFEYELAKAYAEYLGVRLKLKMADKWEAMIPVLNDGTGAIIAAGVTITPAHENRVAFSNGYMAIQPHIITHRNNRKINHIKDLANKTIHVRSGSAFQKRLEELQRQGASLTIQLYEDVPTEELIQKVSDREIEVTIAASNIAILNRRHYPLAVMKGTIGAEEQLGWAVNPNAHQLRDSINAFFHTIKENGKFDEIYNKYYGDTEDFDYIDLSAFHRRIKTRLSRYSPFIKAAARDPWARSHAGARGLMQLLPRTAKSLGVSDIYNPVENINGGVQHLKNLFDLYDKAADEDRLLISLAAYNIGQGHISDARRLAIKMKLNPNQWSSLSTTLPLLRYKKYYKKAKYGYCRGTEPVKYIKQIMIYYDLLKRQGIESGTAQMDY